MLCFDFFWGQFCRHMQKLSGRAKTFQSAMPTRRRGFSPSGWDIEMWGSDCGTWLISFRLVWLISRKYFISYGKHVRNWKHTFSIIQTEYNIHEKYIESKLAEILTVNNWHVGPAQIVEHESLHEIGSSQWKIWSFRPCMEKLLKANLVRDWLFGTFKVWTLRLYLYEFVLFSQLEESCKLGEE